MRACITILLLGLALHAHGARELKWGWSSAGSLGQLSTTTGANTNSGLLSTVNPGVANDGGMLAGGTQAGGSVSNMAGVSNAAIAEPPLPPGMARPPALPGTPAYARQQARERAAAAALAPAPAAELAVEGAGAPAYEVYVGAEGAPAAGPASSQGTRAGRNGAVSNRAGARTEGADSPAPAPPPTSRNAGGLPGLANPFPANGLIWTAG
ncbi:hypothetical protein COCOBI_04-6800 [Coccomyxa sp. Obi]|nr:hypothetical protein COCOBI_04-6800 [Coccomyxa sp. Obi]